MPSDVVIKVEGVGKKFCRSLKRSVLYGAEDVARDIFGIRETSDGLRRDEFWALSDVSFEVKRGECFGLIGPNGAGKSTLLKMLNGLILPDKGTIKVRGHTGALLELGAGFHPMLTGRENIYLSGAILGLIKKQIDKKFDEINAKHRNANV
jgi:lipopolysaccharide transport system ATP-binding protein